MTQGERSRSPGVRACALRPGDKRATHALGMTQVPSAVDELAVRLRSVCQARAVIVWAHCRHAIEVVSAWGARESDYNLARAMWERDRPDLQDGRSVTYEPVLFLPLMSPHRDLVGVLELAEAQLGRAGTRSYLEDDVGELGRLLACPLPKATPELLTVPLDRLAQPGGADRLLRAMFVALLERNGWNVARLADELGLPRQTLQNQLRRLGVRRDVPSAKDRRRRPAAPTRPTSDLPQALRAALWPRVPRRDASRA